MTVQEIEQDIAATEQVIRDLIQAPASESVNSGQGQFSVSNRSLSELRKHLDWLRNEHARLTGDDDMFSFLVK